MCFIKKKIFPKVEIFVKTVCLSRGTKIGENRPKLALFNSYEPNSLEYLNGIFRDCI